MSVEESLKLIQNNFWQKGVTYKYAGTHDIVSYFYVLYVSEYGAFGVRFDVSYANPTFSLFGRKKRHSLTITEIEIPKADNEWRWTGHPVRLLYGDDATNIRYASRTVTGVARYQKGVQNWVVGASYMNEEDELQNFEVLCVADETILVRYLCSDVVDTVSKFTTDFVPMPKKAKAPANVG